MAEGVADSATGAGRDGTRGQGDRPGTAALLLRPVGYWCLAWVWVALWLVGISLAPGAVAYVWSDDEVQLGSVLADSSVVALAALVVLIVPLLAAVMGPGAMFWVPTMAWPLALLCFTYAFRALRPSYAREPLSYTTQAPRGSTVGPPTIGTVALSLKPVRRTRVSDVLMKWYMVGWDLHTGVFFAALPAGLGWVCFFVWASRDVAEPVRQGLLGAGCALVLVSVVLVARAVRDLFRQWDARQPTPAHGE